MNKKLQKKNKALDNELNKKKKQTTIITNVVIMRMSGHTTSK